jgi:CBS domain containing-hemolysin-like protein
VKDIMTPRTVIAAMAEATSVKEAVDYVSERVFSRIPVYAEHIDEITGFVLRDDILMQMNQGQGDQPVGSFKRNILAVPEVISVSQLLDRLLRAREQIAVVIDEHGGTCGLVTLEDLMETLIGAEIMDEFDKTEDMRALARKLWRERARALGIDDKV